jgi:starch phosphorylase
MRQQLERRGASRTDIHHAGAILDPRVLTIGFARRFSTYKRGGLIFTDLERLASILNAKGRSVQIILAGKAHPLDNPGKEIIKSLVAQIAEDDFRNRVVFLEDYDINVARYLVQGADIWLNTPRRPQEASGTSGMKAALNGALNLSVLDGWWCEGYNEQTGFKIGSGEEYDNIEVMDQLESEMLYDTLEREVIPLFYERNEDGLPEGWIAKMKASIQMAGIQFTAQRMVRDYANETYIPAIDAHRQLTENGYARTRSQSEWYERVRSNWNDLAIEDVSVEEVSDTLFVGQKLKVSVKVRLGNIGPDDIRVEVVAGQLNSQEEIREYTSLTATLDSDADKAAAENDTSLFQGEVICRQSGRFGVTARILPQNEAMQHTVRPKLISWW